MNANETDKLKQATKTIRATLSPRSKPGARTTARGFLLRLHNLDTPPRFSQMRTVMALLLATGLWTVPVLAPPTALAAARVSLTLKGQWRAGGHDDSGYGQGVAVAGNHAYWADGEAGLQVIDVSNPANPVRVAGYATTGSASSVAVAGNYAFVAENNQRWTGSNYVGRSGLRVIDVSEPANPVPVGGYDTSGYARAVAVAGNYAYVADDAAGLQVIDVSNPANPVRVGGYDSGSGDVAVAGGYAYVAGYVREGSFGLHAIDISDPANPVRVGSYEYETSGWHRVVAVAGNYAYVADEGVGGVAVIDVSNPANPMRVGYYQNVAYDSGLAVVGNLIYVANGWQGLWILEQSAAPPPAAAWVRIPTDPASTPRARSGHAMVYDAQRGVVVMHGGMDDAHLGFADTWEWDGNAWTLASTNGPRLVYHGMAYDAARGVTVLYGGQKAYNYSTSRSEPDTWEWDGQSWTKVETAGGEPLFLLGMAYDQGRRKVVRHGGIANEPTGMSRHRSNRRITSFTATRGNGTAASGGEWTSVVLVPALSMPWPTIPSAGKPSSSAAQRTDMEDLG